MVIVFCCCKIIALVRILFTQLIFYFLICSFCLEAKEPKIQDLETPAKNLKKLPNISKLTLSFLQRLLKQWIFLTEILQIFLTPSFPRSFLLLFL